ncbi:MAG: hypothetical protein NHG13_00935 [Candidatus Shikimatogenerans bostrichidophilus]|nr:MAG: hypothetical protein NHG13_00935 [Candidatus Shikimatogenerans bostrichidophilus]
MKLKNLNSTNKKQINIIIKGDVYGSIEAIIDELEKISNKNYFINIIKKSVGNITESDIMLAKAVKATIIGFNIKILVNKKKKINYKKIYLFNLIYDIIDFFKEKIKKKEKITKKFIGSARIIKKFKINNIIIFGCIVLEGKINIKNKILVFRNKKEIYDGSILSIKRFNKNVNEVNKKNDFGIIIKNYNKLKKNDIIKSYIN